MRRIFFQCKHCGYHILFTEEEFRYRGEAELKNHILGKHDGKMTYGEGRLRDQFRESWLY